MGGIGDAIGAAKLIQEAFPRINWHVFLAIVEYLEVRLNLSSRETDSLRFWWRVIASPFEEDTEERRALYKRILEKYLTTDEGKTLQRALEEVKEKFFLNNTPSEENPLEKRIRREIEEGKKRGYIF
jgi:hypothetical protein